VKKFLTLELLGMVEGANVLRRMNHYAVSEHHTTWKNDTYLTAIDAARRQGWFAPDYAGVHVEFRFTDNHRRDSDNYIAGLKGVIDGLVRASVIKDDDFASMRLTVSGLFGQPREGMLILVVDESEERP
jgi:Holliday junction resolvase RusA-like endonuclease